MKEKRTESIKMPIITSEQKDGMEAIGWKYRLYPTKEQAHIISQNIDAADATYNFLLSKYNDDIFENTVSLAKELGLEDKLYYNENNELVKGKKATLHAKEVILEEMCNRYNVPLEYEEKKIKNKETGEVKVVRYLKIKNLRDNLVKKICEVHNIKGSKAETTKAIEELGIRYQAKMPSLHSYTEIKDSVEGAEAHFDIINCSAFGGATQNLKTALENCYKEGNGFPIYKKRSKIRDEFGEIKDEYINGTYMIDKKSGFHFYDVITKNEVNDKYVDVSLTKEGIVRMRMHRPFPEGSMLSRNAKITKTSDNKFYISFTVWRPIVKTPTSIGKRSIGIDLSLSDDAILVDNNGHHIVHTAFSDEISRLEARKKILQQALALKETNSANYEKLSLKINKLTARITRKRDYELTILVKSLVEENDIICMEDLDVKAMQKKPKMVSDDEKVTQKDLEECRKYHESDLRDPVFLSRLEYKAKLRRKLQAVNLGKFSSMLELETKKAGKHFVKVDRFYPSTQTCSCCGAINKEYAGLENTSKRVFVCNECGLVMDRDTNAATNILNEGLRILSDNKESKKNKKLKTDSEKKSA